MKYPQRRETSSTTAGRYPSGSLELFEGLLCPSPQKPCRLRLLRVGMEERLHVLPTPPSTLDLSPSWLGCAALAG